MLASQEGLVSMEVVSYKNIIPSCVANRTPFSLFAYIGCLRSCVHNCTLYPISQHQISVLFCVARSSDGCWALFLIQFMKDVPDDLHGMHRLLN